MSQRARSAADHVVNDRGRTDVAIIGGGLAGLVCAIALRDSGLAVSVFEGERMLGTRERIASHDLAAHVERLQALAGLGFETIVLHNVGRNQVEFMNAFGKHVLPCLRVRTGRA